MHGRHLRLMAVLVAMVLVAACTGQTASPTPSGSASQPSSPNEPSPSNTGPRELVVAERDIHYEGDENTPQIAMFPSAGVFETLVVSDVNLQVQPGLATSWEVLDGDIWRFHLKPGVTLHSGRALDATAVAEVLNKVAIPDSNWQYFNLLGLVEGAARVVDDLTVDLHVPKSKRVLEVLTNTSYAIWDTQAGNPNVTPVGTGPFKFVEYVKDQRLVVEKFEGYWGTPPGLDKITFRYIPDETSRMLALQAGEVQMVRNVTPAAAAEAARAGLSGYTLIQSNPGSYRAWGFSPHLDAPYDLGKNINIRRAVAAAIDRDALVELLWPGFAEPNTTYTVPSILGSSASLVAGPTYDPDAARQLLEDDGWEAGSDGIRVKDGRRLTLQINLSPDHDTLAEGEAIQSMLKEVGIELTVDVVPDQAADRARYDEGRGDLWSHIGFLTVPDPCNPCYRHLPSGHPNSDARTSRLFDAGTEYASLVDSALGATDPAEVQKFSALAMQNLVDTQALVIPIAGLGSIYAISDGVTGLVPHPSFTNVDWGTITFQ